MFCVGAIKDQRGMGRWFYFRTEDNLVWFLCVSNEVYFLFKDALINFYYTAFYIPRAGPMIPWINILMHNGQTWPYTHGHKYCRIFKVCMTNFKNGALKD